MSHSRARIRRHWAELFLNQLVKQGLGKSGTHGNSSEHTWPAHDSV